MDWAERERELLDLLDRHRRTDGRYDVLVPGSGGKDSIYAAHLLSYKYGMHPLTVTWAPHIYTEVGWRNFQSWIHSGFDNYLCTPNGRVHRTLTRLAFENLLHPFQPFIFGQKAFAPTLRRAPRHPAGGLRRERGGVRQSRSRRRPRRSATCATSRAATDSSDLYLGGVRVPELAEHGISPGTSSPTCPRIPRCSPTRRSRCTTSATTSSGCRRSATTTRSSTPASRPTPSAPKAPTPSTTASTTGWTASTTSRPT